jgi:hypothetical protein
LTTANGLDFPAGFGIQFASPVFQLQSSKKSLSGSVLDLMITCESPLSTTGPGGVPATAVNSFTVTFRDECYDTQILVGGRNSYAIPLYQANSADYTTSKQTITTCPPVYEELILVSHDAQTPAAFSMVPGVLSVDPKVPANLGTYDFVVKACVDVDNGFTAPICKDSPRFSVQITDPCGVDNKILTAPISTIMSKPQLQSEVLTLN